ncbi:MAG: DJ-1/PfpI family protein [Vampirovibrionales bacterium]|nr:DJ-1/PfpI family protein [Vampirovibrionales bacterium]
MNPPADPRQILMVIAPDGFRDEELLEPRAAFQADGFRVDTVSVKTGKASGMLGASEPITRTITDILPQRYEAIVIVGGIGAMAHLWRNADLHSLLQTMAAQGAVISAICLSPATLALAGLLQGKRATVWEMPESIAALQQGGAVYTGDPVTIDGRLVTANGPDAAADFARAILSLLALPTSA